MTRAGGITGEGAGWEREPGKTDALFLHHVVFLLPLPLLQCCLSILTMTSSRPDLFLTIFRQLMEQRDLNHMTNCYYRRNKM